MDSTKPDMTASVDVPELDSKTVEELDLLVIAFTELARKCSELSANKKKSNITNDGTST